MLVPLHARNRRQQQQGFTHELVDRWQGRAVVVAHEHRIECSACFAGAKAHVGQALEQLVMRLGMLGRDDSARARARVLLLLAQVNRALDMFTAVRAVNCTL